MSSSTCSGVYEPWIADANPYAVMPGVAATNSMNGRLSVGREGVGMNRSAALGGPAPAAAAPAGGAPADRKSAQARTSAREARCTRRHYNLEAPVHRNFVKFTFLK